MQYSRHGYETHAYLLTYFAVTLSLYTGIPTVYRALLKSAVSGTGHWIHTTKEPTSQLINQSIDPSILGGLGPSR